MKNASLPITLSGFAVAMALVGIICFGNDKPAAKTVTDKITLPDSTVEFTLVKLPPGKITLKGKDGKEKEYEIKPIWMGRTEVTWDEYDIFWLGLDLTEKERARISSQPSQGVRDRPYKPYEPPDRGFGHEGFPACGMPCFWARKYCEWLSKKTGKKCRLPTEAEWEYACRAGDAVSKPDKNKLDRSAWYDANSDDQTHHVAKKETNSWGIYDMLGNVAEWVLGIDASEAIAGGSFQDDAADVHAGARAVYDKKWQRNDPRDPKDKNWLSNGAHVGFRVVRED